MPKEPETIDRYQIIAETSLEQTGFVLAALTKMVGVENVRCELVTDVLRFKGRRGADASEGSGADFAAEYVKENPRFTSPQLVAHFTAAGRTPSGAYYAIKKLTETNVIRQNGNEYVRVEALPAPEFSVAAIGSKTRRPPNPVHRYDLKNSDLIANAIKGRTKFTMAELRTAFEAEGRNPKSISPILTGMIKSKRIKIVSTGHYVVLAKGIKAAKASAAERRERDRLRHQASRDAAKKKPTTKAATPAAQEGALLSMMNGSGGETTNG